ncbi:hypothetical protein [Pseudactinotalea sp. Z1732]|uniref:hypothetical protein n=1 Tax=Micrococcales TaxID=85006 RepID=UPI003C7CCDF9
MTMIVLLVQLLLALGVLAVVTFFVALAVRRRAKQRQLNQDIYRAAYSHVQQPQHGGQGPGPQSPGSQTPPPPR